MLSHYLRIIFRQSFLYRKFYFINILGLSIGISASLLILLYVSHELSTNNFHTNGKNIYSTYIEISWGGVNLSTNGTSGQFGAVVNELIPGVTNFVRLRSPGRKVIESDQGHRFFENNFVFADSSLFSVFSFPLLQGSYHSLGNPNTVIITESIARKYFGRIDVLGETLIYDKAFIFEITGIAKDIPSNSSIRFDFVASFKSIASLPSELEGYLDETIGPGQYTTYLFIPDEDLVNNASETINNLRGNIDHKFTLTRFIENGEFADYGQSRYLWLFVSISMIILGLALINYMNLTTARATLRAKEVGIRKINGASRSSIALQFYLESGALTFVAFILSFVLLFLVAPLLMKSLGLNLDTNFIWNPYFISILLLLFVFCVLIAGSYPAIALSAFIPAEVLKGKVSSNHSGRLLRKGLTTLQFTSSLALIVCSLVVQRQLEFMQNKNLGLNKDQVLVIALDPDAANNFSEVRNELKTLSAVEHVGSSTVLLYTGPDYTYMAEMPKTKEQVAVDVMQVDQEFFNALGIQWIAKPPQLKSGDLIVNEAALNLLGIDENHYEIPFKIHDEELIVKGIIRDFNYNSLHEKIRGLMLKIESDSSRRIAELGGALYVHIGSKNNISESVRKIENIFKKYNAKIPFGFYFLDDAFNTLYKAEQRLAVIFKWFTIIAVFIACLGLLGLVLFTIQIKGKEISIRKVLGATVFNIIILLSAKLWNIIVVSIAITIPITYFGMQNWLQGFAYRIDIPWIVFLVAALVLTMMTTITIGFHSYLAASVNPVKALKTE